MSNIKSGYYNSCDAKRSYCVICQSWLRIMCLDLSSFKVFSPCEHYNHPPYPCAWSEEMSSSLCVRRDMEIDIYIYMVTPLTTKRKVHLLKFNSNIMALLFDIETAMVREVYDEINLSCTSKALFQTVFGPRQICMVLAMCGGYRQAAYNSFFLGNALSD
ncbi:hypothetical protein Cgig2_032496 [Carnegiea gigantea]|uniref:Uncharacterized protein n=1 Tax=Carnegiea gigantea TaxID=171969 RepID=A0A9Q1QRD5_9CARY|nr:hypothetical protein Cgig2_032496 [Carnegiea gigantea]